MSISFRCEIHTCDDIPNFDKSFFKVYMLKKLVGSMLPITCSFLCKYFMLYQQCASLSMKAGQCKSKLYKSYIRCPMLSNLSYSIIVLVHLGRLWNLWCPSMVYWFTHHQARFHNFSVPAMRNQWILFWRLYMWIWWQGYSEWKLMNLIFDLNEFVPAPNVW